MARPTVASLSADLAAAINALNTYVGQVNELHNTVRALQEQVAALTEAQAPARARAYSTSAPRIDFSAAAAARKAAVAKFFELNPSARSVTDSELRSMGFMQ
jgi:hypothetical protein